MVLNIWKSTTNGDNNWYAYLDELCRICNDTSDPLSFDGLFGIGLDINKRFIVQTDGIVWFLSRYRNDLQPRIIEAIGVDGLISLLLSTVENTKT